MEPRQRRNHDADEHRFGDAIQWSAVERAERVRWP
jgi:hypothetical protein